MEAPEPSPSRGRELNAEMPLHGIRVLDLTRLLPGAFCTMLLADLGADVIKVEEPTGDYMRWAPPLVDGQSALFNALNRNKRSLTLNLKSEAGLEVLLSLAERSAVLVEGNRPGVMDRLGLGWDVLQARNPKLVMCSITGYGQDGPFASRAGRGDQGLAGRHVCYRIYACKGGGYYSVGALEPKFWAALCEAIDRPDLVELQFAEGPEGIRAHAAMESVFASKTRSEWEAKLAGLDVCCEPVLELDEVASHPQVAARGLISRMSTGVEVRPAVPLRPDWRRLDPPALGEHSAEILSEI